MAAWQLVNIGAGNGSVLSGIEPLPEPTLTQMYDFTWYDQATIKDCDIWFILLSNQMILLFIIYDSR